MMSDCERKSTALDIGLMVLRNGDMSQDDSQGQKPKEQFYRPELMPDGLARATPGTRAGKCSPKYDRFKEDYPVMS